MARLTADQMRRRLEYAMERLDAVASELEASKAAAEEACQDPNRGYPFAVGWLAQGNRSAAISLRSLMEYLGDGASIRAGKVGQ